MTASVDLDALEAMEKTVKIGPLCAMRDGNQYINTEYMPTATLVGASRIVGRGALRPWNPHRLIAFGFAPTEYETNRFEDSCADYIVTAVNALPTLITELRAARASAAAWKECAEARAESKWARGEKESSRLASAIANLVKIGEIKP